MARRFACEELVRLRRADEQRRYLASQRSARIDPNPHQIDAVIFALQRIPKGGCILADEVGLGKTIEAGLTLSQLLAEGASRILLLTPKPLLGQWKDELLALFGITAREGATEETGFEGPGVFIAGREYAGSQAGAAAIGGSGRFDLCVIDEAHELFAGIYRRYDLHGGLKDGSKYARTAARVKQTLLGTPMLLLTATPIQNTLTEMWGLVQYVEPTGTLLGDLGTFRTVFCDGDDRRIRAGQHDELKRRLATVCQRTLRRQAQTFMAKAFTQRTARLFEYSMSPQEAQLYDDVTAYLLDPKTLAFRGSHRRLLLISFHRRMGSSQVALADSLQAVADRLRRKLGGSEETLALFESDFDDEDPAARPGDDEAPAHPEPELLSEMKRVQALADRARSLRGDSKAEQLCAAVRHALSRAGGSGKLVIFTEALSTQRYLAEVLVGAGLVRDDEITLFRGQNTGPKAASALARWEREVGARMPADAQPSRSVAVRLALVHEFATHTKVFISTEAGAKGLNLQFCDTVINYDLPWNPQRIEQRIGRCHRYGQTRDVTVINFINRDNEAQRLTFEILSRKLELFGTVLDASDAVLHQATAPTSTALVGALASDFEARLADVYDKARSPEEIAEGMAALQARVGEAKEDYEDTHARTAGLIETRFDSTVRAAFRSLEEELPEGLAALDRELEGVLLRFLDAAAIPYTIDRDERGLSVDIEPHDALPPAHRGGVRIRVGDGVPEQGEPLHVGHALVRAALEESRQATRGRQRVCIAAGPLADDPAAQPGVTGRIAVIRMQALGFEPVTELLPVVLLDEVAAPLLGERARAWVLAATADATPAVRSTELALDDGVQEAIFVAGGDLEAREHLRFEETLAQIERSVDDRVLAVKRVRSDALERKQEALARRNAAVGPGPRTRAEAALEAIEAELEALDAQVDRLLRRDDPDYATWRSRAYVRRYTPPTYERILDVEFVLA
ncbi:MAG: SNF2-related protein [Nannocystaceae bacterium]|nr:DEAD/DEAH box helicase [bacterium]